MKASSVIEAATNRSPVVVTRRAPCRRVSRDVTGPMPITRRNGRNAALVTAGDQPWTCWK